MQAKRSLSLEDLLDQVTTTRLAIGLGVVGLVVMLTVTSSAYTIDEPLPPPGPPPPTPEGETVRKFRYLPTFYRSVVEEDAEKIGIAPPKIAALAKGNRYRSELSGSQRVKPGKSLETRSLRLKVSQRKLWVGEEGRRFRSNHLLLKITNISNKFIAYRVTTKVSGDCQAKAVLSHNALALAPGASALRTECAMRKGRPLLISKVEVLELSALGYHYVSRLEPRALHYPRRTSEGHEPGKLPPCRLLPWKVLDRTLQAHDAEWYDVVDFYSRHNCDEYSYFAGYTWSKQGPKKLPVKPLAK